MSAESRTPSVPFRFAIYWVAAEEDGENAQIDFESVEDWIERLGGHVEGGSMQRMDDADVVENSPLWYDIRRDPRAHA